jgi:ATP-dependent exoDNAse (exonuclease V) beta subunit
VDSLRLLRELYVAVTRARRRVVILYKQRDKAMRIFFESLKCDLEMSEASVIMLEFDKATTNKEWFDEGSKHFNDEKYPLAAVSSTKTSRETKKMYSIVTDIVSFLA